MTRLGMTGLILGRRAWASTGFQKARAPVLVIPSRFHHRSSLRDPCTYSKDGADEQG
jgi:hypothetical protein